MAVRRITAFLVLQAWAMIAGEAREISPVEARMLILTLLKSSGCTSRTCDIEAMANPYFPRLLFFEALSAGRRPKGSLHMGAWAVDPNTGDLWDANVCVEYRSAAVEKLQRQLRKRIGLTEGDYQNRKQRPPMCEAGEAVAVRTRY